MRSGDEYLRALRDRPRRVYVNGELVEDVASHPAFAGATRTVARLYDIANDPANRERMTFASPDDRQPINLAWLVPRTREDLTRRREAIRTRAEASYGFLGRSPDHVASFFAGFAGSPDFFARGRQEFAAHLLQFYDQAAREDLYLSYAIVHPVVDRSRRAHEQAEPF